jgi:disulfide bond formation protein DsbB
MISLRHSSLIEKIRTMPLSALLILAACAGALAFVFIMQYGFGYKPCELCWLQRLPYAAAICYAGVAVYEFHCGRPAHASLYICAILFFIGACLAFFHTGIEQHWWLQEAEQSTGCMIIPLKGASAEIMRMKLLQTLASRCDVVTWTFLNFSMANWNILASSFLCIFSLWTAKRESCLKCKSDNQKKDHLSAQSSNAYLRKSPYN